MNWDREKADWMSVWDRHWLRVWLRDKRDDWLNYLSRENDWLNCINEENDWLNYKCENVQCNEHFVKMKNYDQKCY